MKKLALVVGAWLALTLAASAQVAPPSPSGNECWNAGQGPGGPSNFLCINQVRNSTGYQLLTVATGAITVTSNVNTLAVNVQPANNTTISTPPNPTADGQLFQVCNVTAAAWVTNTVTLQPSSGQTIQGGNIALTTLTAHNCVEMIFQLSSTTWFQIR